VQPEAQVAALQNERQRACSVSSGTWHSSSFRGPNWTRSRRGLHSRASPGRGLDQHYESGRLPPEICACAGMFPTKDRTRKDFAHSSLSNLNSIDTRSSTLSAFEALRGRPTLDCVQSFHRYCHPRWTCAFLHGGDTRSSSRGGYRAQQLDRQSRAIWSWSAVFLGEPAGHWELLTANDRKSVSVSTTCFFSCWIFRAFACG